MARIDLDARRAEEQGHTVVFGGREYAVAGSMPIVVAELFADGRFREALRVLVPDLPPAEVDKVSVEDVKAIGTECYGLTFPESEASSAPSRSTGTPSTLTSLASTA